MWMWLLAKTDNELVNADVIFIKEQLKISLE